MLPWEHGSTKHPVPGVDYPRTFQEFDEWFGSEAKCREYVRRLRWPDGFVCQECGVVGEAWVVSRERFRCRSCKEETSLTAGTIFADTRKKAYPVDSGAYHIEWPRKDSFACLAPHMGVT